MPRKTFTNDHLRQGRLLPWLVLMVSLLLTFFAWDGEQKEALNELKIDFDFRVREANTRTARRLISYEQILRGVRGLIISSQSVSPKEFHNYIKSLHLEDNYPGSHDIGFALATPHAQKTVQQTKSVVTHLETASGSSSFPVGSDMYSDPVLRAAMEQSRITGQVANSGKVLLPLNADEDKRIQGGFLMFLPVYLTEKPLSTIPERRDNFIGWVYASFRMVDLMAGITEGISTEIDIEVHDGVAPSEETMMYDPDLSGISGIPDAKFSSTSRINVANHAWALVIRSLPGFEIRADNKRPKFVALSGISASMLLALITWLLVQARMRAMQTAESLGQELSERKRAERGLQLAAIVGKTVEEAVLVSDANNLVVTVNDAFTSITGYSAQDVIGKNPRNFIMGNLTGELFSQLWETLLATGSWHGEIQDKRKNGEDYIKWLSIKLVHDENGQLTHHVQVFSDISKRKAAEQRMRHLAHFDSLTDLPNRTLFRDRLQQEISRAEQYKQDKRDRLNKRRLGLMFIDLDKFKPINDMLGHAVGDQLLKEVAKRLLNCVRESDVVSRLGGDEFVVMLADLETEQDAMLVAEKMLHSLGGVFELAGHSLHISASIGLAIYPDHGSDEATLTRNADIAMYYAKASGRNTVKLFKPDMSETGAYRVLDGTSAKPEPPRNRE